MPCLPSLCSMEGPFAGECCLGTPAKCPLNTAQKQHLSKEHISKSACVFQGLGYVQHTILTGYHWDQKLTINSERKVK